MKYVYKIRRKKDGLFSCGGSTPKFKKTGKVWNSIGSLKNHFALIKEYERYKECRGYINVGYKEEIEIVEILVQEEESNKYTMESFRANFYD